ncbi:hypothetical protein KP509_17G003200 [Ceratopteris richardii]|uniref:Uncharacterized protein n=1 Tax=Ceratopteris richardii TaxID=49495 RepID=A0A8T2SWE1_CERRI|nr:hypothetical protein KP509_17G003200 [Ceratopteris richardii]
MMDIFLITDAIGIWHPWAGSLIERVGRRARMWGSMSRPSSSTFNDGELSSPSRSWLGLAGEQECGDQCRERRQACSGCSHGYKSKNLINIIAGGSVKSSSSHKLSFTYHIPSFRHFRIGSKCFRWPATAAYLSRGAKKPSKRRPNNMSLRRLTSYVV